MREIEFRGKRKDNDNWVYGSLIVENDKYYICLGINDHIKRDDYEICMVEVVPETVGQYIRRKDNLDKKIYENDIVIAECKDLIVKGKVLFEKITNSFFIENILGIDCKFFGDLEVFVVGNIHDNPEMLNVGRRIDMLNLDFIEISKANIDVGEGESQTAKQIQLEMTEREKRIKELTQYSYKAINKKEEELGWNVKNKR